MPDLEFENRQYQYSRRRIRRKTIEPQTISDEDSEGRKNCHLRVDAVSVVKHAVTMHQNQIQQNRAQGHAPEEC